MVSLNMNITNSTNRKIQGTFTPGGRGGDSSLHKLLRNALLAGLGWPGLVREGKEVMMPSSNTSFPLSPYRC